MKRLLPFFLAAAAMLFPVIYAGPIWSAEEAALSFTNKDLEKYKSDSAPGAVEAPKTDWKQTKKEKTAKAEEERDKEYWCKRASSYREKMAKAKAEKEEIEIELSETAAPRKRAQIEKSLDRAKKQLNHAERDFADLGDEAYRKGVPQGWLRCQFE